MKLSSNLLLRTSNVLFTMTDLLTKFGTSTSVLLCKELLIVTMITCIYAHRTLKIKARLRIIQAVRMLSRCISGDEPECTLAVK